jgi:hypothetical protein
MNLQNGYKVIYEKAADGKRTFYASKQDGSKDKELATFTDSEYRGRMLYEYKGSFYVSAGATPKYDESGKPAAGEEKLAVFDEVFIKAEPSETQADEPAQVDAPVQTDEPENTPAKDEPEQPGDDEEPVESNDNEIEE